MGRFNKKHRDKSRSVKPQRSRQTRHDDERRSHVPTAAERNDAANCRTIKIENGPFKIELSPLEASLFRRTATKEDRELGRLPATIWIDYEMVLEIDHHKIENPKTKSIVMLWKMGAGIPIPFHTNLLLSPSEAQNQDLLWTIVFSRLPVTGEKVCADPY